MKIKFYRLLSGHKLHAYGDPIGTVPVDGRTLRQFQKKVINDLGYDLVDVLAEAGIPDPQYFIFEEDLVFSHDFIKSVLKTASTAQRSLRFCLTPNSFNERFALPHYKLASEYLRFPFYYRDDRGLEVRDAMVEQKVYQNQVPMPRQMFAQGHYSYDQSTVFIIKIVSPFHLLQANLAILFSKYIGLRKLLPQWLMKRIGAPHSRLFYLGLKSKNKFGKNCKIHPTAVIEGAEIGDNVTIGAHTVVRLSKIGAGTTLEEHCVIKYSVLGANNYISNGNQINGCHTFENVFLIHGPYQVSSFGRDTTVMAVINCDIRLDQKNIMIETSSGLLDSKQTLLGVAYGHGAKVGGGNIIAPGRIVPNQYRLAPPGIIKMSFEEKSPEVSESPPERKEDVSYDGPSL
jgi:hypothetical protein